MRSKDSSGYVFYQFPNWPLFVMLGASVASRLLDGLFSSISSTIFYIAGVIWAYEEMATGVNLFRRMLGLVVMLIIGYGLLRIMI